MPKDEEGGGRFMKESLLKLLKEMYGITSVSELNRALSRGEKLNIGIMTTGGQNDDRKVAGVQRAGV